jgi:hypothetical protein
MKSRFGEWEINNSKRTEEEVKKAIDIYFNTPQTLYVQSLLRKAQEEYYMRWGRYQEKSNRSSKYCGC